MYLCSSYHDESLIPPPESGDGAQDLGDRQEALIEPTAYMFRGRNHTTAHCSFRTKAGNLEELQVTFFITSPPHVSYFCIAYTSGEPTRFISEPLLLATAGRFALISVKEGPTWLARSTDYTYLMYQATNPAKLTILPLPQTDLFPEEHCYLMQGEVGIFPYQNMRDDAAPSGHSNDEQQDSPNDTYKIAALYTRDESSDTKNYDLYIYDASTDAWTREQTVFPQEPRPPPSFSSDRCIAAGGTMIWADLSQGMILCELQAPPEQSTGPRKLRYVRLPMPLQPRDQLPLCVSTASFSRDIAILNGHIYFVDLEIQASPGSLLPIHWTAVTCSMAVDDSEFHKEREVKSCDIASDAASDPPQSFMVGHPTLSSHNGDILYSMAKTSLDPLDQNSSVIAVNTKLRKMERVAKYTTQRGGSMDFAYMLTTISKYLAPPGGNLAD